MTTVYDRSSSRNILGGSRASVKNTGFGPAFMRCGRNPLLEKVDASALFLRYEDNQAYYSAEKKLAHSLEYPPQCSLFQSNHVIFQSCTMHQW